MSDFNGGQAAQGALGGATAGAAFGPLGMGIGAIGGGLLGGLFGGDGQDKVNEYQEMLKQLAAGYGRRTAPTAGPGSYAENSQFRQNQAGLISQLEAMGRGEGPSAARMQMQDAMDRAAGAQASAAAGAGGRGVNAGAALRGAMNNTAAIQAQGARDTATLRANEQMGALSQLGQNINAARGADEQTSQFNAGVGNQINMANLQSQLQTMGLNQQGQLQALMAALGSAQQGANQPGFGTQLMAFGAGAAPGLMQMRQAQNQQTGWSNGQSSGYGLPGGANRMAANPNTNPAQTQGFNPQALAALAQAFGYGPQPGQNGYLPANQDPWNSQYQPDPWA